MKKKFLYIVISILLIIGILLYLNTVKLSLSYSKRYTSGTYDTAKNIVQEVMKAFYFKGTDIQYNYAKAVYTTGTPEDATSQDIDYKVCAAFTYSVYREAFGVNQSVDSFPIYNYNIIDEAEKYYNNKGNLDGNFILYYVNKNDKVKYSANGKYKITEFVDQLKPGDLLSYTGHAMIVYDVGINPKTKKKDALIMHSAASYQVKTRIGNGTSRVFYDIIKKNSSNNNLNGYLDMPEEGSIKTKWLSEFKHFTSDGKTMECNKERCAIIRVFYKDKDGNAVFNYKIKNSVYNNSKLRTIFKGFTLRKTVNKGDNDSVNIKDELVYTIKIENNSTINSKGVDYKNFYVEETLGSYVDFVSASDGGTYSNGVIKWKIDKLAKGKSLKLTYKVKVKNNLKYINKIITAEGKVYQNKNSYLTTGIVKNKIVNKVTKYKNSYESCYNKYKSSYSSLELIDKVLSCSLGKNYDFKNKFSFDSFINAKSTTGAGAKEALTLKPTDSTNKNFKNMILNNYWGGLVDLTVSGNKKLNLPRWSGDSASRNRNINKSDFKNGDILIYQINNKYYSRNYSEKTTYTKEDGLYAYIYINGSFVGVNGSGDTKRNSFTFSYYTNIYKTTDYKEKYSNINDFYNAKFYSNYNGIKDNQSMLEYINYLTLFDKDRFVILRPELIVAELIGVKISKDPKYNYIQGESIDKSVGSLLLSYSNGTTSEKKLSDSSVLVKTFDTSTVGKSKVVLSCGGFSVTYTINVTAKKEPEPIVPKEPKPTQPKEEEPIVTPTTPKEEETPETPVVETPTIPEEQSVTEPPIKQEEPTSKPPVSDEDSINEYQGENSQSIIEEPIEEQSEVEVSLPQPSIWFDIILGGIGFIFFILIIIYVIKGKKSYY